jgi:hypothetical protein
MTDAPKPMTVGMGDDAAAKAQHDEMLRKDAEEAAKRERAYRASMERLERQRPMLSPQEEPAPVRAPRAGRYRSRWWPLHVMTGTQAKLVGGALATILIWVWGRVLGADQIPGEVGASVGVLLVALIDMTLGGKKDKP